MSTASVAPTVTAEFTFTARPGHAALYSGLAALEQGHETVYIGSLGRLSISVESGVQQQQSPSHDEHGATVCIGGVWLTASQKDELLRQLWINYRCIPVLMSEATERGHYEGYCKEGMCAFLFSFFFWLSFFLFFPLCFSLPSALCAFAWLPWSLCRPCVVWAAGCLSWCVVVLVLVAGAELVSAGSRRRSCHVRGRAARTHVCLLLFSCSVLCSCPAPPQTKSHTHARTTPTPVSLPSLLSPLHARTHARTLAHDQHPLLFLALFFPCRALPCERERAL